mmetsp:Transcript_15740/g.26109  ORF Transcript_15740/g.26109 Transcript_15740/m.26109 type:complete len:193 (-) Transcript_15740:158-736(-)
MVVLGQACSADIYALSCLTSLTVAALDDRDDWPVQAFLVSLQFLNTLDNLSIMLHDFTETELTVEISYLRVFMIIDPKEFKLQTIRMHCPKLKQLNVSYNESWYGGSGNVDIVYGKEWKRDDSRGALQCIDLSACADLKCVNLGHVFIHSLSVEWIQDLVSNGRNQALITNRRMITRQVYSDRMVCKEKFKL